MRPFERPLDPPGLLTPQIVEVIRSSRRDRLRPAERHERKLPDSPNQLRTSPDAS